MNFSYAFAKDSQGNYLDGCGRAGSAHVYASIEAHKDFIKQYIPEGTPQPPTEPPTENPTQAPTQKPTEAPTQKPTEGLTEKPTEAPTQKPTEAPTQKPTQPPTQKPTQPPTQKPTEAPTVDPPVDGFKPLTNEIDDSLKTCSSSDNGLGGGRIIGGVYTDVKKWPFIVWVDTGCGGTIIGMVLIYKSYLTFFDPHAVGRASLLPLRGGSDLNQSSIDN